MKNVLSDLLNSFVYQLIVRALRYKHLKTKIDFSRSLPVDDLIFSRDEIASLNTFGEGSTCYASTLIIGPVKVGKNCWVGPNVVLDGSGGLSIGDSVHISAGVQVYSHDSILKATSLGALPIAKESTVIGNGVYIGPNAVIQKGVSIGDNVIIGACSLVNKNVPNGGRYLGTNLIC